MKRLTGKDGSHNKGLEGKHEVYIGCLSSDSLLFELRSALENKQHNPFRLLACL